MEGLILEQGVNGIFQGWGRLQMEKAGKALQIWGRPLGQKGQTYTPGFVL